MAIIEEASSTSTSSNSATPTAALTVQQRLDKALQLKQEGNEFWMEKQETRALERWHEALLYSAGIDSFSHMYNRSTEVENKAAAKLTSDVHSNLSAYYISKELYAKAIQSSQRVLKNTPNSLKALYRCGLANLRAGNLQEAAVHIGKAMDYAPDDAKIRALGEELVETTERLDAERKRDTPKS